MWTILRITGLPGVFLALDRRHMTTRSKTGSLTPKLFADSVTVVTTPSLRTACNVASGEETNSLEEETGRLVARSKTTPQSLLQQSQYFKLGQCLLASLFHWHFPVLLMCAPHVSIYDDLYEARSLWMLRWGFPGEFWDAVLPLLASLHSTFL